MSRPRYENELSCDVERKAIITYAAQRKLIWYKLPVQFRLDFVLVDKTGRVVEVVEVKSRKKPFREYQTFIVSACKYLIARVFYETHRVPVTLLVRFPDGLLTYPLSDCKPEGLWVGGRYDRGDWQDVEPVIRIPMVHFMPVEESILQKAVI